MRWLQLHEKYIYLARSLWQHTRNRAAMPLGHYKSCELIDLYYLLFILLYQNARCFSEEQEQTQVCKGSQCGREERIIGKTGYEQTLRWKALNICQHIHSVMNENPNQMKPIWSCR